MILLPDDERQRLLDEIRQEYESIVDQIGHSGRFQIGADEKIPAADIDAGAERAQKVTRSQWTLRNIWRKIMRKMIVEQLDEHRRRKRSNQLVTVPLPKSPSPNEVSA